MMLNVFFVILVDHLGVFGRMSFQVLTLFIFIFKAFKNFGCAGSLLWRVGFPCCRARLSCRGPRTSLVVPCRLQSCTGCGKQALPQVAVCGLLSHDMWDLSSPTRDWTYVPCIGKQILNHWTTRDVPLALLKIRSFVFLLCQGPASAESRDILRMDDIGKWRKIDEEIKKETTWGDQASVSEAHLLYSSRGFYTLSYTYSKVKNAESTQHSISNNFYQYQVLSCKSLILCTSSVPEACWYSMTSFW